MTYRVHVQVYNPRDGARLSAAAIKRDLAGMVYPSPRGVGAVGTRSGAPGIWVRRDATLFASGPERVRAAVVALATYANLTGFALRFVATNAKTAAAIGGLVKVERG